MTKDELIEKYRDVNVDYEWWQGTYENFIEDMEKIGLCVDADDISFEGFYHQGSHARIDCTSGRHIFLFMEHHKLDKPYNAIYKLAIEGGVRLHKKGRSVDIDIESWEFYDACGDEDMNSYYKLEYQEEVERTYAKFEDDITEILENYEDDLYRQLRDEYEWLSSDEAVWEAIVANEWDEQLDENINRGLQLGETK
jgi:hypothetical protein